MPEPTRSLRILVVDDDPLIRRAARRALSHRLRCEVVCAGSGYEALALVHAGGPFHVVVLDLEMPGLDGYATLAMLGQLAPELPVGIWSGRGSLDEAALERAAFVLSKCEPLDALVRAAHRAAPRATEVTSRRQVTRRLRRLRRRRASGDEE